MDFCSTGFTVGNYEVGQTIGNGSSSKVKLGRHVETGDKVALKIYRNGTKYISQLKQEIAAFKAIGRHPNIIRFLDILATDSKIYLVLEYASGGDLLATIAAGPLTEPQARKYFQELLSAVSYCHSKGVYHRDIKPENLLLDDDGNLKLADFGLSAVSQDLKSGLLFGRCGTEVYMAPEVLDSRGNNGVSPDLWSCGVVLFFMLSDRLPFMREGNDHQALYENIRAAKYLMPKFSAGATYVVHRLLTPNPVTRIGIAGILHLDWFRLTYKPPQLSLQHPQEIAEFQQNLDDILRTNFDSLEKNELQQVNPFRHIGAVLSAVIRTLPEDGASRKVLFTCKQPVATILDELETYASSQLGLAVVKEMQTLVMKELCDPGCTIGSGGFTATAEVYELTPVISALILHKTAGDNSLQSLRLWEQLSREMQIIVQ